MNNLNSILIEGCLISNPKLKKISNNISRCEFRISSYGHYQTCIDIQQETLNIDVVCYKRLADICGEYLDKGRCIRVVGRLFYNGESIKIKAEHIEFKPQKKE